MKYWEVKSPKEHKGVYSKPEVIKEKQSLLQGTKDVQLKLFDTNEGQTLEAALSLAGVSGKSFTTDEGQILEEALSCTGVSGKSFNTDKEQTLKTTLSCVGISSKSFDTNK